MSWLHIFGCGELATYSWCSSELVTHTWGGEGRVVSWPQIVGMGSDLVTYSFGSVSWPHTAGSTLLGSWHFRLPKLRQGAWLGRHSRAHWKINVSGVEDQQE